MRVAPTPVVADVDELVAQVSNWGRWGDDDELGTLNLISEDNRRAAAQGVREGCLISLGRPLSAKGGESNPHPILHHMLRTGLDATDEGFASASDWFGITCHGFHVTHIDALSHVFWRGKMYNDQAAERVNSTAGSRTFAVDAMGGGIVTRGVLFDLPRHLDVAWLEPGMGVTRADLEQCERELGVDVEPGDAVVLRTGRDARSEAVGPHEPMRDGNPGLLPECARWLHERDVSLLVCDAVSDVMVPGGAPHTMPIHAACIVGMGMPLVDNALLEPLATTCAETGQADFLLTVMPLAITRATGSPVNPSALL